MGTNNLFYYLGIFWTLVWEELRQSIPLYFFPTEILIFLVQILFITAVMGKKVRTVRNKNIIDLVGIFTYYFYFHSQKRK